MNNTPAKVLIIEDNELNLKLFRDLLSIGGHESIETRDGADAVRMVKSEQPDLIILDIQLPNISGIDLIEFLKSNDDLRRIPIIAVTAYASAEDERKIRDAGCEDYLAKPLSIDSFLKTVNKYV
jgi:two-component system, cell cycle response regulator DivK